MKTKLLLTTLKFTGSKSAPSYISVHTKVSDLTYDPSSDLSAALLQGQSGFLLVLKKVVREHLFPKVKFINKNTDLSFNYDTRSVCGSILKWLNLQTLESGAKYKFWSANSLHVDCCLTQHRSTQIKKFKNMLKVSNKTVR